MQIMMRHLLTDLLIAAALAGALRAQTWEVGASAGYGTHRNVDITGANVSGKTGFNSGLAFGVLGGNDMYKFLGGEARYTYRASDLKLSSGAVTAKFQGEAHAVHYDFLLHARPRGSMVRPFFAAGAGVKYFRGTGAESAFQPLSNLALLTHASEAKPLLSVGGGVKAKISRHGLVRFDVRDYATPFPEKLIAPRRDVRVGGWLHDFVFLVGVSAIF